MVPISLSNNTETNHQNSFCSDSLRREKRLFVKGLVKIFTNFLACFRLLCSLYWNHKFFSYK